MARFGGADDQLQIGGWGMKHIIESLMSENANDNLLENGKYKWNAKCNDVAKPRSAKTNYSWHHVIYHDEPSNQVLLTHLASRLIGMENATGGGRTSLMFPCWQWCTILRPSTLYLDYYHKSFSGSRGREGIICSSLFDTSTFTESKLARSPTYYLSWTYGKTIRLVILSIHIACVTERLTSIWAEFGPPWYRSQGLNGWDVSTKQASF